MDLKKKFEETKNKLARHQTCVAAIGSMLVTAGVLGYLTGKELKGKDRGCAVLTDILDDFADGEKHAAWLKDGYLYVQPEPLSAEDL